VEINFEQLKEAALIFEKDLDPERIIRSLSLLIKTPISTRKSKASTLKLALFILEPSPSFL